MKRRIIISFLEKGTTVNSSSFANSLDKIHFIYWMTLVCRNSEHTLWSVGIYPVKRFQNKTLLVMEHYTRVWINVWKKSTPYLAEVFNV